MRSLALFFIPFAIVWIFLLLTSCSETQVRKSLGGKESLTESNKKKKGDMLIHGNDNPEFEEMLKDEKYSMSPSLTIGLCREVLELEPNNGKAHYIIGESYKIKATLEAKTTDEKSTWDSFSDKHFAIAKRLGYQSSKDTFKQNLSFKINIPVTEIEFGQPIFVNIEITNICDTMIFLPGDIKHFLVFVGTKVPDEIIRFGYNQVNDKDIISFNILMPGDKWITQFYLKESSPIQKDLKSKPNHLNIPDIHGKFELSACFFYPTLILSNSVETQDKAFRRTISPLKDYIKDVPLDYVFIEAEESIFFEVY